MDGIAVSGGLLPLASGVIDANCDFRLDGTLPGTEAWCGCRFLGGVGCAGTEGALEVEVKDRGTATGTAAGELECCGAEV
jgi:hypothetical protein